LEENFREAYLKTEGGVRNAEVGIMDILNKMQFKKILL
jgi:hypothetical protein